MPNTFKIDGEAIQQLAELLDSTGLNEIEYEMEGRRIRVARGSYASVAVPASAHGPAALREEVAVAVRPQADHPGTVKSPMVGTVYLAPTPGSPSFVKVGDTVNQGDTLLIIEAMKVMNPIRAPKSGQILEIIAQDASPVEFGSPLLVIEP